ncbi:MAG: response regulator [Nitrospira sp.]|nr:response regulator [Nitrospira sp.]
MALAVTEAEPKKAIHFASRYLDSDASHSQSDFCGAQELVRSINEEKRLRPTPSALVVEDDPDIALALQDLLEFEGFHVDCAPTCRQAFASIAENTYDVVLLDLGLPDGDGSSILEGLQVSHPALPVIVLTASNRDLEPLPAFAHLTKPWIRRELCNVLHKAVGTTSTLNVQ